MGHDKGVGEYAEAHGCLYVPQVEENHLDHYTISSMFAVAQRVASHGLSLHICADTVLLSDFMPVVSHVTENYPGQFLAIGARKGVVVDHEIDFDDPGWERELLALFEGKGRSGYLKGSDFFLFRTGFFGDIPPFSLGQAVWDGWVMNYGLQNGTLINVQDACSVIHQNHGPGNQDLTARRENKELAGERLTWVQDAEVFLTKADLET